MTRYMYSLFFLLFIIPNCYSTGIVWIRMSASKNMACRMEVIDKDNSSRYGISLDLQLQPNIPKEFVLPMPTSSSPIPIFDYSIQTLSLITGNIISGKKNVRLPLLVNDPWVHKTISNENGVSVFTSIRFECLPSFYGPKCQYYCTSGEKCSRDECPKRKCQNNSQCQFDGSESKCVCQSGYIGEFCEIDQTVFNHPADSAVVLMCSIVFLSLFIIIIAVMVIMKQKRRTITEPTNLSTGKEFSVEICNSDQHRIQILTPAYLIFSDL